MALLTYEYRLYPRRAEQKRLSLLLEQGRQVYNGALAECKASYEASGTGVTGVSQWDYFREWRKQEGILLNASSLQHLLRRVDKSYTAFFRRVKAGEQPGYPRFKGEHQFKSVEYTYGDGCKLRWDATRTRMLLYVQNIGELKIKFHRPLPENAQVRHVILKRKASGWYVYFQMEVADREVVPSALPPVGIDVGLLRLLTLSDGTEIDNPRWLRGSLTRLRVAQRRLSRRQRGSRRRKKARQQVALLHEHIANTRKDFWHKTARWLVETYGKIALEELHLAFMLKNASLARSAHDAGLGRFNRLLDSKAANAGVQLVRVDPAYTSQMCSACGAHVPKTLSERTHACPHCNLCLDRDVNAARNIYNLAFKSAWTEPSGANAAPLSPPAGSGKRKRSLRSSRL
jgi:putative transposase